jgi:drug/metabolite transporter (DMT)-like permease
MIYFLLIGSLLSTILVVGKLQPINQEQALIMLATGGCLVCFQFLLIKAYTYAKPHEIGAFQYSSVVFAAFLGWILFKEQLDLGTIIGTVLICAGGILSISKLTEGKKS